MQHMKTDWALWPFSADCVKWCFYQDVPVDVHPRTELQMNATINHVN